MTPAPISGKALLIAGLLLGFFLIPPLAEASPKVVNGFLLLVLMGILLMKQDQWLPLLARFNSAAGVPAERQTYKTPGGNIVS